MARDFAISFYRSKKWKDTQRAYMINNNYLCERCGQPAKIVHHKTFINPNNINDPNITLAWDNLQCVCMDCHAVLHGNAICSSELFFDENGNLKKKSPPV